MAIQLIVAWYGRDDHGRSDYDNRYIKYITGKTPEDCMAEYMDLCLNHDIAKYTRTEIVDVRTV